MALAERLCGDVDAGDVTVSVSATVGAVWTPETRSASALVGEADQRMYRAKQAQR